MRCWWIGHDLTIEIGICGCHDVLDSQEPISDVVALFMEKRICALGPFVQDFGTFEMGILNELPIDECGMNCLNVCSLLVHAIIATIIIVHEVEKRLILAFVLLRLPCHVLLQSHRYSHVAIAVSALVFPLGL